jgi:hypothetical protein
MNRSRATLMAATVSQSSNRRRISGSRNVARMRFVPGRTTGVIAVMSAFARARPCTSRE